MDREPLVLALIFLWTVDNLAFHYLAISHYRIKGDVLRIPVGDLDRAVELQQEALAADPLSLVNRFNLSAYLLAAGRYDDALREAERAAQLSPDDARTAINIGFAFIKLEQYERALELAANWPDGPEKDVVIAMAGLVLNREAVATEAMARLKSSTDIESYRHRAELEAFCENIENSFLILAQLRDQVRGQLDQRQWRWQLLLIRLSPFLAPLRADPRWQDWLEEQDHVSAILVAR